MVSPSLDYLKVPSGAHSKLGTTLQGVFVVSLLATVLLLINILQILTLFIRLFSRRSFRAINIYITGIWWNFVAWLMVRVFGVKTVISGDPLPPRENVLLVSNHQEMTDIPVLIPLAKQLKCLGRLKWIAKYPMKFFPGPGWGMHFTDCVFVKRDWAKDQASIKATFATLRNEKVPAWLIMFPEGTRITPNKLAASQAFAKEKSLWIPETVMIPRTKGFAAAIIGLGDHLDAVYDITIGYPQGIPSLGQFMSGLSPEVHMHIKRIPLADLPRDEAALASLIMSMYEEKNQRLAAFKRDRCFK